MRNGQVKQGCPPSLPPSHAYLSLSLLLLLFVFILVLIRLPPSRPLWIMGAVVFVCVRVCEGRLISESPSSRFMRLYVLCYRVFTPLHRFHYRVGKGAHVFALFICLFIIFD